MNVAGNSSLLGATALNTAAPDAVADKRPTKLADAAKQFESLMIGELLKSAGGDGSAWLGDEADNASETAMGMAQTYFAQAMSSNGGFGLAKSIEKSMTRPTSVAPETIGK